MVTSVGYHSEGLSIVESGSRDRAVRQGRQESQGLERSWRDRKARYSRSGGSRMESPDCVR